MPTSVNVKVRACNLNRHIQVRVSGKGADVRSYRSMNLRQRAPLDLPDVDIGVNHAACG